jgi:hypothetical protein
LSALGGSQSRSPAAKWRTRVKVAKPASRESGACLWRTVGRESLSHRATPVRAHDRAGINPSFTHRHCELTRGLSAASHLMKISDSKSDLSHF